MVREKSKFKLLKTRVEHDQEKSQAEPTPNYTTTLAVVEEVVGDEYSLKRAKELILEYA